MKTNKLTLLIIIGMILFTSLACTIVTPFPIEIDSINVRRIEGSGEVITEERNVSDFDRITLTGFGRVYIMQGDEESLTVTTDDNIMPYIETEVKGNTLVLGFTDDARNRSFDPSEGILFNLVLKELNRVDISGAGDIQIDALKTEKLTVDLSGAGNLDIQDLEADELVVHVSGAGNTMVSGKVKGQEISLSGAGNFNATDLESETAFVKMSGVGSANVWVTETLDLDVSGLGNVEYYGTPRVTQNVSGFGKVISRGDK